MNSSASLTEEILAVIEHGTVVLGHGGEVEYASPRFLELLGYGLEEVLGKRILEFLSEADQTRVRQIKQDLLEGWRDISQMTARCREGNWLRLEVSVYPRAQQTGVIVTVRDLAMQKTLLEESLMIRRQYEQELEFISQITTNINQGLVKINHQTDVVYCNQTTMHFLGIERPALVIGRNLMDFVALEDKPQVILQWKNHIFKGETRTYQHRINAYGAVREIEVTAYPTLDEHQKMVSALLIITDITTQVLVQRRLEVANRVAQKVHQAKRQLEIEDQKTRTIAELLDKGLGVFDQDGKIEFVNQIYLSMLGYGEINECGHLQEQDFFHPDDLPIHHNARRLFQANQSCRYRLRLLTKSGQPLEVEVVGNPRFVNDQFCGSVLLVNSLQAQSQRERELLLRNSEYLDLLEQSQADAKRLRLTEEIRSAAAKSMTTDAAIQNMVQAISRTLDISRISVYLHEALSLLLRYEIGYAQLVEQIPLEHTGMLARAFAQNRVLNVADAAQEPNFLHTDAGIQSGMYIPIGQGLGVLSVESELPNAFNAEDAAILLQVTDKLASRIQLTQTLDKMRLFENVLESSHEFVLITDANLVAPGPHILYANNAMLRHTGYSQAEVLGKSPRMLQGQLTDRATLDQLKATLLRGEHFSARTYNYKKDGSHYVVEWNISPVRNDKGVITHYFSIQRDWSERTMLDQLLRKLSLEMNLPVHANPLQVIGRYLELKTNAVRDRQLMQGKLENIGGMSVLLQMLNVSQASGEVKIVVQAQQQGILYLEFGKIVAVSHPKLQDKAAIMDLMALEVGEFEFDHDKLAPEKTMLLDPTHVSLELARLKDESTNLPNIHLVLPDFEAAKGFALGVGGMHYFTQKTVLVDGNQRLLLSGRGINVLVLE